MGGLDNIIAEILHDAKQEADLILEKANKEAAETRIQCEKDKQVLIEDKKNETQKECMKFSELMELSAEAEARQMVLAAKTKIITELYEYIREDLKKSDEYFDILLKFLENSSEEGDGVMYLSKRDLDRLPADFPEKAKKVSKGNIEISPDEINIDGGFIIKYGKIDINCSIDAIFEEKKNKIFDIIKASIS